VLLGAGWLEPADDDPLDDDDPVDGEELLRSRSTAPREVEAPVWAGGW
jgi:hypothetical protein